MLAQFWERYRRNRAALIGLAIQSFILSMAVLAPILAPVSPFRVVGESFSPPSWTHPMGTDDLGRDIFSGVIWGSRPSLIVGFFSALISMGLGAIIGGLAGFLGGTFDDVLMRITDIFLIIPTILLAIVVAAIFGGSTLNIMLIIGALSWPIPARLVRAEFLSLREREFVEAAKSVGVGKLRIVFSEILPSALPPLIISSTLLVGTAILVEAGLSFLGVGDPNIKTLGGMLNIGNRYLRIAWWTAIFPGIVLSLTVLSVNLIGDGLNDALNPRLRHKERR